MFADDICYGTVELLNRLHWAIMQPNQPQAASTREWLLLLTLQNIHFLNSFKLFIMTSHSLKWYLDFRFLGQNRPTTSFSCILLSCRLINDASFYKHLNVKINDSGKIAENILSSARRIVVNKTCFVQEIRWNTFASEVLQSFSLEWMLKFC